MQWRCCKPKPQRRDLALALFLTWSISSEIILEVLGSFWFQIILYDWLGVDHHSFLSCDLFRLLTVLVLKFEFLFTCVVPSICVRIYCIGFVYGFSTVFLGKFGGKKCRCSTVHWKRRAVQEICDGFWNHYFLGSMFSWLLNACQQLQYLNPRNKGLRLDSGSDSGGELHSSL